MSLAVLSYSEKLNNDLAKNSERLARIRENQRKSRAKRQEYLRELEQRLETCKEEAKVDYIKHLLLIQKLESENQRLREMLGRLNVSPDSIQEYLSDRQSTVIDYKVAIPNRTQPNTSRPSKQKLPRSQSNNPKSPSPATSEDQPSPVENPPVQDRSSKQMSLPFRDTPSDERYSDTQNLGTQGTGGIEGKEIDTTDTTLHIKAEELIHQYNTCGIDIDKIWRRLAPAIIVDREGQCCRVQNQALFQILDEISNEL